MLFNSYVFLYVLLPVCFLGFVLQHGARRRASWWLFAASFVFYGWWDWRYCILLAVSVAVNFTAVTAIRVQKAAGRSRVGPAIGMADAAA